MLHLGPYVVSISAKTLGSLGRTPIEGFCEGVGRQIRLKSGERRRSCCCKDYQWPYSGGIFGAGSGDLGES